MLCQGNYAPITKETLVQGVTFLTEEAVSLVPYTFISLLPSNIILLLPLPGVKAGDQNSVMATPGLRRVNPDLELTFPCG